MTAEEKAILDVEGTRLSATTGLLELGTLGAHEWLLVLVWTETKVPDRLTSILRTTQENRVATRWSAHRKLVKREALAASGLNARTSSVSEAKGSHAQLRHLQHTVVVRNRADDHHSLWRLRGILGNTSLVTREVHDARH